VSSESRPERRPAPRGLALVVDDDPAMRTLVKDLLAWEGVGARELPSGEGLIEAVEQEEVTLVKKDGSRFKAILTVRPMLREGKQVGFMGYTRPL